MFFGRFVPGLGSVEVFDLAGLLCSGTAENIKTNPRQTVQVYLRRFINRISIKGIKTVAVIMKGQVLVIKN